MLREEVKKMGAFIDMRGQQFGRLTVVERKGSIYGKPAWLCACSCGATVVVYAASLRKGHTRSCGCWQREVVRETVRARAEDLTGREFGRLTVISKAEGPQAYWICTCTCGGQLTVSGRHLRTGHTQSCGCLASELTRQRNRDARQPLVGYGGAHDRLKRERGPAAAHPCTECGQKSYQWSYDHMDPEELVDPRGYYYSLEPTHYVPRCASCHRKHDHAQIKRRKALT